jgi:eukaryotic-like serine/threonine-protein kinase
MTTPTAPVPTRTARGPGFPARIPASERPPRSVPPGAPALELPEVGTVLDGKYRIDTYIGTGSMGAVARAKHLARDADVALKFLTARSTPGDERVAERFRLEAIAASRLHTDHVVRVFDVAESREGLPYLVMELLEGEDLDQLLMREGAMEVPRAVHIVLQALRALDVAHAAGVVHRDLKPGNMFVLPRDGDPDFVKIVDFGISKVDDGNQDSPRLTQGEMAMGTPLYMAPEQASDARSVKATADVYSAAAVLYECIAGVPPLVADRSIELLFKLLQVTPQRLDALVPEVPQGLADAIALALSKDPKERPPTAAAFAALLAPYADERSVRALVALRLSAPPSLIPSSAARRGKSDPNGAVVSVVPKSSPELAAKQARRSSPELDALLLRKGPLTPVRGALASSISTPPNPPTDSRPPVPGQESSTRQSVDLRALVGDIGDVPSAYPPPRTGTSHERVGRGGVALPASTRPPARPKPSNASWAVVALVSFAVVFLVGVAVMQLSGMFRASAFVVPSAHSGLSEQRQAGSVVESASVVQLA